MGSALRLRLAWIALVDHGPRAGRRHAPAGARRRSAAPPGAEEIATITSEVTAYFEETYHSYYLTSDLRDDGLIDPLDTRNTLGMSLSAALNAPIVRRPGGVLRI